MALDRSLTISASVHLHGNPRRDRRWPTALGVGFGAAAAFGGLLVAAGWLASVPGLVRSRPGPATVTFNEAIAVCLLGAAAVLLNLHRAEVRPWALRRMAAGAASLAGVIAAASVIDELARAAGLSFGVGQLVVRDHYTPLGRSGQMAPEVAAALLLLAGAVLVEARWPRRASVVAWLSGAALAIVVVAAVELAGSDTRLFGLTNAARIAVPSAIMLTLLGCAVQLAESDRGGAVWSLWIEQSVRASMLRVFVLPLPLVAIAPLCVCVALVNQHRPSDGRIVAELGTATLASMVLTAAYLGSRAAARVVQPLATVSASATRIVAGHFDNTVSTDPINTNEVTELARAFDQMRSHLEMQARAQTLAHEAKAVVSSAPDLASAFRGFAEGIARIVPFDRTSYIRLSDDGSRFEVRAVWGPESWRIPAGTSFAVDHHLIQRYLNSPVVVDHDLAAVPDPDGIYRPLLERGIRSSVVLPLIAQRGVRALVSFSTVRPNAFSSDDVVLLQAAARETAAVFDMLVGLDRERQAVEQLKQLDQLKNEFVGMVAHDLRSPMGIIAGFADTLRLRWGALGDDQREEFLTIISRNVTSLALMIEDVLDVARIESGEFSYKLSPFALAPLVRRTLAEVVPPFGSELDLRLPDDLPLVMGDEHRLWQVLTNLISNARKFSGPGVPIKVSLTSSGDELRVEVADRGPGIAPEDQERVFDKFTRLPVHVDGERVQGTGLGLYICRSLVRAQRGSIGVESKPGLGATFWFTVPVAQPVSVSGGEIAGRSAPA